MSAANYLSPRSKTNMNIKIYQFKRDKPQVYKTQDYLTRTLSDTGRSGDSIKELNRILENQSKALALIITKMAEEGKVSAKDVVELGEDYYEDAEFSE